MSEKIFETKISWPAVWIMGSTSLTREYAHLIQSEKPSGYATQFKNFLMFPDYSTYLNLPFSHNILLEYQVQVGSIFKFV